MDRELFGYAYPAMTIVSSVLAIVLATLARKLAGKGWLIAFTVLSFAGFVGGEIVQFVIRHAGYGMQGMFQWYAVVALFYRFGTACLGLFLLSNYAVARMNLDVKNLLFSFSGRTPRSVFWISVCILFPLGTLIGIAPLQNGGGGFTREVELPGIVFWSIYACYCILSTWMTLAVYAKRWHDCSKSGWMTLIVLLPVIGGLWLIGYLGFVRGADGPNQYGENPFNLQPGLADQPGIAGNA
jgi:uncharacterized membrane protein YhaH (DUF805 family)